MNQQEVFFETHSGHPDFQFLNHKMEQELRIRDGDQADAAAALNAITEIPFVLLMYQDNRPVACGGLRVINTHEVELKRFFVLEDSRRKGYAARVLKKLEEWSFRSGWRHLVLETGKNQPEAIAFYLKNGYHPIPAFGMYQGNENSVCFEKWLMGSHVTAADDDPSKTTR